MTDSNRPNEKVTIHSFEFPNPSYSAQYETLKSHVETSGKKHFAEEQRKKEAFERQMEEANEKRKAEVKDDKELQQIQNTEKLLRKCCNILMTKIH